MSRDAAAGVRAALLRPEAAGQTLLLSGCEVTTVTELGESIARRLGAWIPPLGVPEILARAGASVSERFAKLRRSAKEPFLTHSKINLMTRHYVCDTSRASTVLGFRPAVPLERGLDETVAWSPPAAWIVPSERHARAPTSDVGSADPGARLRIADLLAACRRRPRSAECDSFADGALVPRCSTDVGVAATLGVAARGVAACATARRRERIVGGCAHHRARRLAAELALTAALLFGLVHLAVGFVASHFGRGAQLCYLAATAVPRSSCSARRPASRATCARRRPC
jgi:hypothetical protein